MKKFVALALSLIMTLGLVACGGGSEPAPAPGGNDKPAAEQPAPSGEVLTFKMAGNSVVSDTNIEHLANLLFCEKVEEYSNGTMKVDYFPASQLGNSTEMVEGCSMGTIEVVTSLGFDLYANMEPSAIIYCMPYLFKDYDHLKAALETENWVLDEVNKNMIEAIDVKLIGYGWNPFRNIIVAKGVMDTLTHPDQLKGLNFRSPEAKVSMDMVEAWGATPVTITLSELYTSMQQGTVACAEMDLPRYYSMGYGEIVGVCAETDHMQVNTTLCINNTFYESLTPEQQEVIDKAAKDFTEYTWNEMLTAKDNAWAGFAEAGAVCVRKADLDYDAFVEANKDVYKDFIADGWFTQEMYDFLLNMEY